MGEPWNGTDVSKGSFMLQQVWEDQTNLLRKKRGWEGVVARNRDEKKQLNHGFQLRRNDVQHDRVDVPK